MNEKLLQLPFEIQAVLAIGYVAYRLATTGLDKHHRTGDFVFQVLVYGALAKAVQELVASWLVGYWLSFGVALPVTLGVAACWRAFGNRLAVAALRKLRVTRENYSPSTWASLLDDRYPWRYVSVLLDDGTWLDSNIDALPPALPHDPLDVDTDGNIALYVTRRTDADGTVNDFDSEGVIDAHGRANLTYVPAASIKRITVSLGARQATAPTSSAEAEAEAKPAEIPDAGC